MKTLFSLMLMLASIAGHASQSCTLFIDYEGDCVSTKASEEVGEILSEKGYILVTNDEASDYTLKMRIDTNGIQVGCSGEASLENRDGAIVTAKANNRLTGALASVVTFGYSSVLPPTGRSVAKKLLKRLPDCSDL